MVLQHEKSCSHVSGEDRSTKPFHIAGLSVCIFLFDSPVEFVLIVTWAASNCINADDSVVSMIYKSISMSVSTSFLRNHLSKLDVKHETVRKLLLNAIYNISEGRMESPGLTATSALNKGLEGPAVRFFCLKDDHHVCSQIKTRSVLTGKQTMKN